MRSLFAILLNFIFLYSTGQINSNCITTNNLILYSPGTTILSNTSKYPSSIAVLGDINGDGNIDVAVGSNLYQGKGGVIIMFLDSSGKVDSSKTIGSNTLGFTSLASDARFGSSLDTLGDLDGDGITELAVGAMYDYENGFKQGAAYILFLNQNGGVKSYKKIDSSIPFLQNVLINGEEFGRSIVNLGDIDNNGTNDLGVGAWYSDDSTTNTGAAYIIYLDSVANPISYFKIGNSTPGFIPVIDLGDYLGYDLERINDFDGNGVRDVAITAMHDDDGGTDAGALYICLLDSSHTLKSVKKISANTPNLPFSINSGDWFGDGMTYDPIEKRFFVSSPFFDGYGNDKGAIHTFQLDPSYIPINYQGFGASNSMLNSYAKTNDRFGNSLELVYGLFGNKHPELFITSYNSDTLGSNKGVLFSVGLKDTCNTCLPTVVSNLVSICPNDSVLSPKGSFVSTPGYYYDTLMTIQGCDSILSLQVSLNQVPQSTISPIVCEQYNYPSGKGIIDSSGSYLDTLTSHLGCDSLVQINLTVTGNFNMLRQSGALCSGSTYQLPNGNIVSTPGIYYDTVSTSIGCDSIIETTLTTGISYYDRSSANICQGNVFTSPSGKTFFTSQNIWDTLPTINGCDSVFEIFLTIHPTPTNVSIYPADTTICAGDFVTLNVGSYLGYQWSNASTQSSIMVSSAGTYTVTVSNSGNCTGTASTTVSITTNPEICGSVGIIELVEDIYKIFPNPTKDEVFISLNNLLGEANITLIDLKGTEYYKANTQVLRNKPIQINLTNISSGVYFIKIQDGLGVTTKKLIIQ